MCLRICTLVLCAAMALCAADVPKQASPTYSKDVAAIMNQRCVECHRTGEIGPMPLTSYKEVRPFARAIRDVIAEGKMPPWFADPHVGKFSNDRRLTEEQKRTLLQWVSAGAPEGNPKDLPPAPKFVEGWQIGKPDVVFNIPQPFTVPAEGVVDYQYVTVPTNFTEDKWVSAAEVRPGDHTVVHHVIAFVLPSEEESRAARERAQQAASSGTPQTNRERSRFGTMCEQARPDAEMMKKMLERIRSGKQPREQGPLLVGWAPGLQPEIMEPGSAKLLKAGSRLLFQLHYTPNGKSAVVDKDTRIGLVFSKTPVTRVVHTVGISNMRIKIPPEDPNYEAQSCFTFNRDVTLVDMMPHMHYRGKDMTYVATYPDGRKETLLSVPNYDFSWQLGYILTQSKTLPAGTKIECTAHFDNSARNKYNPDPTKEVRWGDQTWEEMLIGWVTLEVPRDAEPVSAGGASGNK